MTCLQVRAVCSPREQRQFLEFPAELYRGDLRWVPPLASDERQRVGFRPHPFHAQNRVQAFVAQRGSQIVGRIAAIHNVRHNQHHGERRGFFGFFECRDDGQAATGLVGAAAGWLAAQNLDSMRGPVSPSIDYQAGLLIDGFERPPSFMMPYNPGYYGQLMAECGLAKSQDLFAFQLAGPCLRQVLPRLKRVSGRLADRHRVTFRRLQRRRFRQDLDAFLSVVNRSLAGHWGYVPLAPAEMSRMADDLAWLLVPELVVLAEVDGQPIGVALGLPDYSPRVKQIGGRLLPFGFVRLLACKRRIRDVRIVAANVLPDWQRSGIGVALTAEIMEAAIERGAENVEFSWVAESNALSHSTIETGGARRTKTYRIYDAPL
ncbi:MAG TPA: GNAT family N-acetyltransferase [Pirellulales bacterium]